MFEVLKYLCRLVERDTAETSGKKFLLQYWFMDELCLWSLEACLSIQVFCCVKVTFFVPFLSSAIFKNILDIKFLKYKVFPLGFFPVLLKHLRGVIQSGVWLEGLPNLHEINMGPDFIVSLQLYHFHPISCWLLSMHCVFLIAEGKAEGAYLADSYHVFWCLEKKSFHWVCGIEESIPQLGIMVRRRSWQVYQWGWWDSRWNRGDHKSENTSRPMLSAVEQEHGFPGRQRKHKEGEKRSLGGILLFFLSSDLRLLPG